MWFCIHSIHSHSFTFIRYSGFKIYNNWKYTPTQRTYATWIWIWISCIHVNPLLLHFFFFQFRNSQTPTDAHRDEEDRQINIHIVRPIVLIHLTFQIQIHTYISAATQKYNYDFSMRQCQRFVLQNVFSTQCIPFICIRQVVVIPFVHTSILSHAMPLYICMYYVVCINTGAQCTPTHKIALTLSSSWSSYDFPLLMFSALSL